MYPAKWSIIFTHRKSLSKGLYVYFDIKIEFMFLLANGYLNTLSYYTCKEKQRKTPRRIHLNDFNIKYTHTFNS